LANRSADFNYKVAFASGAKSLKGGRLRQAEEQFRYLVKHFPGAEGGYRGLAKVLVEQEDRPGALRMLLQGGAALAKANQRASAISMYREAVSLDPHDLTAHRRLASSLALSGETDEAANEYVRYIRYLLDSNDADRAKLEASYALDSMPGNSELEEVARTTGTPIPKPRESKADREALMRTAFTAAPLPVTPTHTDQQPAATVSIEPTPAVASAWDAPAPSISHPPATAAASWSGSAPSAGDAWNPPASGGDGGWAASSPSDAEPEPLGENADALAVEAAAARYLAKGDPRGGQAALEAARRYIADGRMDAASDLLLQLIAAGVADHDAQRLLVEVTRSLGKRDVAKAKVQLLVQALRLDGRTELAAEVEELAQAL
jgi:thioredoxin-like negative regulator of GroEL